VLKTQELESDVILSTLKEADWDVDMAMVALVGKLEQKHTDQRAKAYEAERRDREKEARAKGTNAGFFFLTPQPKLS
jgi:hypothetical protein